MHEIDEVNLMSGFIQKTVVLGDLIRIKLPEAPETGNLENWIINAFPDQDSPIQMLHQRFETTNGTGKKILTLRANQIGKHEITAFSTWGDIKKFFIEVNE